MFLISFALGPFMALSALAQWSAEVRFFNLDPNHPSLVAKPETIPVIVSPPKPGEKPEPTLTVKIEAVLQEKNVSLLQGNSVVVTSELSPQPFSWKVVLTGEKTPISFSKVDATGGISTLEGEIAFDDYRVALTGEQKRKRWAIIPALGFSYVSYTETSVGTLNLFGLTTQVTGKYTLSDRWALDANVYITALPLLTSDSTRTTRFFGFNARGGYKTPWLTGPWTLYLKAGYYFTSMIVSPADHGFVNMNGPQIFPMVTRQFSKGLGSAYLKASPIAGLSFSNREFAGGLGYELPLAASKKTISLGLDIANIAFSALDQSGATRETNVWSFTLTGGYHF